MPELSAFAGFLGGCVVGAALCWMVKGPSSPYSRWLGRTCWVRPWGRTDWAEHVIVAVSWKGAVCVRLADAPRDEGYWIKKQNVRWRVKFAKPEED